LRDQKVAHLLGDCRLIDGPPAGNENRSKAALFPRPHSVDASPIGGESDGVLNSIGARHDEYFTDWIVPWACQAVGPPLIEWRECDYHEQQTDRGQYS